MHNIHTLLFAANSEDNDNDLIFDEDFSLEHNENINENRDSDATQILANCTHTHKSRKASKTAIPSFRTRKTPYPRPTSKPAEKSSSSSQNIRPLHRENVKLKSYSRL